MAVVDDALDFNRVEHLLLVGEGAHLETGDRDGHSIAGAGTSRRDQCVIEPIAILVRVVGLELGAVPVRVKRGLELLQQRWRGLLGEPDVPLNTVEQRACREV